MSSADCVVLDVRACVGHRRNSTTASGTTSNRLKIEVSLCPARPPATSGLFVHCPGLDPPGFATLPRVLRTVKDLFLIRVPIDGRPGHVPSVDESDYFVYRAGTRGEGQNPSLVLLSRPHPSFHDDDVGLLRRGVVHYTVAALIATPMADVFDLHRFHSETGTWTYKQVSVGEPQGRFPLLIPSNCYRLHYHDTSTVVAIGGDGGTMGWVDLWRGMLLCDVLIEEPSLRGVPVPLPLDLVSCDSGLGTELGCPKLRRAIGFFPKTDTEEACLKLVHLEADATLIPGSEPPNFIMHNWAIIIWKNTKMTTFFKDWNMDCRVEASDITMDSQIWSEMLHSGLLQLPQNNGASTSRALQNLLVSSAAPNISAAQEHVIYLMARKKYMDPNAWALALDMRNKTVLGIAEFGLEREASPYSCIALVASPGINLETEPGEPKDVEECTA